MKLGFFFGGGGGGKPYILRSTHVCIGLCKRVHARAELIHVL